MERRSLLSRLASFPLLAGFAAAAPTGLPAGHRKTLKVMMYSDHRGIIDARDYAIDPTGVAPSDVALNLAIQDAITQKKKLIIPSGIFLLNAPLMCFVPGSLFAKVEIEGQGAGVLPSSIFPTGMNGFANTLLCMNSKVLPAVIFQSNRSAVLKNLTIMGLNVAANSVGNEPNDVQANYVTSGCRATQYSPYSGIVIDPFSATSPADGGYPGLTYNPVYAGNGTNGLILENVHIFGFVVGVMLGPTGAAANGDVILYRNAIVEGCDTCFACGDSQARQWVIDGGNQVRCRQVFDTVHYGTQGRSPLLLQNFIFGSAYRVFNLAGSDSCTVIACYSESVKTWGAMGGNGNITFIGCHIGIGNVGQGWALLPPPLVFESNSPVLWSGCKFTTDITAVYQWNLISNNASQSFEQCSFAGTDLTDVPPLIAVDYTSVYGGHLKDCWIASASANSFALSDDFSLRTYAVAFNSHNGRLHATFQTRLVQDANLTYIYQPPTSGNNVAVAATAITITGLTLTFSELVVGTIQLNDILLGVMLPQTLGNQLVVPAWKVTSVNAGSGACIATALFDIAQYDTAVSMAVHFGANTVVFVRHQWAPSQALTGTTATSTALTAVSPTALINGDFVQGAGIPANTRVVSGGGTASLVLSKATTASASGVRLFDGVLKLPTTTDAF